MNLPPKLPNEYNREHFKTELKNTPINEIDQKRLDELGYSGYKKIEILWAANDLAKEGDLERAMRVAEFYCGYDDNDSYSDELHQLIEKGEDPRIISTVKGVISWVLQSIIIRALNQNSEAQYYTRSLDIIEKLAVDKNLYVRQHATIPLELLAANIKAIKHSETGEDFKFLIEDKNRTEKLAFKLLDENHQWDRILEYLAPVFNRMRYLDEDRALYVLKTFFYKDKNKKELRPDYVTENIVALAIYYAEFRAYVYHDDFNDSEFKKFLRELISNSSSRIKSHTLWLIWKNYKQEDLRKIESHLPLFLSGNYSDDVRIQWDFLVEKIFEDDPEKGFLLLKDSFNYTKRAINEGKDIRRTWLYLDDVLKKLAQQNIERFRELMPDLKFLQDNDIYIGDFTFLKDFGIDPRELARDK